MERLNTEIGHMVASIRAGVASPALHAALKAVERERDDAEAELATMTVPVPEIIHGSPSGDLYKERLLVSVGDLVGLQTIPDLPDYRRIHENHNHDHHQKRGDDQAADHRQPACCAAAIFRTRDQPSCAHFSYSISQPSALAFSALSGSRSAFNGSDSSRSLRIGGHQPSGFGGVVVHAVNAKVKHRSKIRMVILHSLEFGGQGRYVAF